MDPSHRRITVRVPATSANMGPGFDCLGMALDIYDSITITLKEPVLIRPRRTKDIGDHQVAGEGLEKEYGKLALKSALALYEAAGQKTPPLAVQCKNEIPIGRGLGSSAAAIVGGLVGANELCGRPLGMEELGVLAARLEGHPDNSTPSLYGGCRVAVMAGERLTQAQIPLPDGLKAALFIPDFAMPTQESRRLLPQNLSRAEAVYNLGRAALLVAALATGHLEHLREATQDKIHQPARGQVFPAMFKIFDAALEAGAKGVYLSGGGPIVLALVTENAEAIAQAMAKAARAEGVAGEARVARPVEEGARVVDIAPNP